MMDELELLLKGWGNYSPYFWSLFYLILANVLRKWSPKVMLHSIFHCMTSTFMAGCTVYIVSGGHLFTMDMYRILAYDVDDSQKDLLKQVAYHSAGYFVGDTIDIKLDYKNEKRQQFVLHHIAALVGLTTVYFDSWMSIYGLYLLEAGGVVHHIKHAAHVWQWQPPFSTIAKVLYHVIYLGSRILLFGTAVKATYNIGDSKQIYLDIMCCGAVFVLVPQNLVWWVKNAKDSLKGIDLGNTEEIPKKVD